MAKNKETEIRLDRQSKHPKAKDFKKYLGYKFYKVDGDDVEIIRIVSIYNDGSANVMIKKEDGSKEVRDIEKLAKEYTPLSPIGFLMISSVKTEDCADVIVTGYRLFDVKMGNTEPYVVCRQSINDFFYNLIAEDPDHGWVGVSATVDNCPTNIPYKMLTACDEVLRTDMVHFYLDDTLDTILDSFATAPYDTVLSKLFDEHMANNPFFVKGMKKNKDHGWCSNLKTLLTENNFISDLDSMRNITAFNFDLKEFLDEKEDDVYSFNDIMLSFFNYIYKINAVKTMVIKYGYDINMGEFNNSNYIFVRDSENITWLVVYVMEGQYVEKDLEDEFTKLGVADKLRLAYYDKYHN